MKKGRVGRGGQSPPRPGGGAHAKRIVSDEGARGGIRVLARRADRSGRALRRDDRGAAGAAQGGAVAHGGQGVALFPPRALEPDRAVEGAEGRVRGARELSYFAQALEDGILGGGMELHAAVQPA